MRHGPRAASLVGVKQDTPEEDGMTGATNPKTLETDSLRAARAMGTGFAWPTVMTLLLLYATGALFLAGAIYGFVPLWLTFLVNSYVAFGSYTPLHEALHGNVGGKRHGWANRVVGVLASWLFLHNYSLQRQTHLSHHANLNDPAKDADHWVSGTTWWSVAGRCVTIVLSHYAVAWRICERRILMTGVIENLVPLVVLSALAWFAGWQIALFGVLLPAITGSALLGFFFDYLVHTPYAHSVSERYLNTRVYLAPRPLRGLVTSLWFAQNYHLIHHLYPWVPFYRYARTFEAVRPLLEAKQSPVVMLGGSAKG